MCHFHVDTFATTRTGSLRREGYVATIERTAGNDAFDAYVTIIDGVSTDPTFLRAE